MKRFNKFLNRVAKDLGGVTGEEFWPLTPGQFLAYFDANFLFDFYNRYQKMRKREVSLRQLSSFFDGIDQINDFLINFACIGFKVGQKFNIQKVSIADRERFFEEMLELAEYKADHEWGAAKIKEVMNLPWKRVDEANRSIFNRLKVALFGLSWVWYFDVFAALGYDTYGPFAVRYRGRRYVLLVDDYFNQRPSAVWPMATHVKFNKVRIYALLRPFRYHKTIMNRLKTTANIGQSLQYVFVERDGKACAHDADIAAIVNEAADTQTKQHKFVEKLTPLQLVDKAMLMYYWRYRKFLGRDWRKCYLRTRKNIKLFGRKFIQNVGVLNANLSLKQKRARFDPRNNDF